MISDLTGINEINHQIKQRLPEGGIVLLKGDLASGKTTLVQSFVRYLGMDIEASSPTFSVMNVYGDEVYHYDIYNEGTEKFIESGLLENLEKRGYHFIEWADDKLSNILEAYGFSFVSIKIESLENKREYIINEA